VQREWDLVVPAGQPPDDSQNLPATRAADLGIAAHLLVGPSSSLRVAFRLGWLPSRLVDSFGAIITDTQSLLGFSDGRLGNGDRRGGSAISVCRINNKSPMSEGEAIDVNGRPGRVGPDGLQLQLADGSLFQIDVDALHQHTIRRADLVKMAQHATFAPDLRDASTWIPAAQAIP
jgi:hypothetical protein